MKLFLIMASFLIVINVHSVPSLSESKRALLQVEIKNFQKDNIKIQKSNAQEMYRLQSDFLKKSYDQKVGMIDQIGSLTSGIVPGKKKKNQEIRSKIKALRKAHVKESKEFRTGVLKVLREKIKKENKERMKSFQEKMKSMRKKE